jgi:hypothetical protein
VQRFREDAEAGLVRGDGPRRPGVVGMSGLGRADSRWVETALEVMPDHTDESKPSLSIVIRRTGARLAARYGSGVVPLPGRATAYRRLEELEERQPTFRLSTKRNRDIAARPGTVYGKLRPTRPGEYLLLDTTRLDVFALDPLTLLWVQAELTAAMDWYTGCITGIRLTPVSTKSVDASSVLYQTYRPRPAGTSWPQHAVWPDHGIPRAVLLDINAIEGPMAEAAALAGWVAPALAPETVVVDHGRIYVSEHLTSVCQRMGISVQPARLRTSRDKGRSSGSSGPCARTCWRCCPATRGWTCLDAERVGVLGDVGRLVDDVEGDAVGRLVGSVSRVGPAAATGCLGVGRHLTRGGHGLLLAFLLGSWAVVVVGSRVGGGVASSRRLSVGWHPAGLAAASTGGGAGRRRPATGGRGRALPAGALRGASCGGWAPARRARVTSNVAAIPAAMVNTAALLPAAVAMNMVVHTIPSPRLTATRPGTSQA